MPPNEADPLHIRRKRARFRAWHRGTQELDLLTGRFADHYVATMSLDELEGFEYLLEAPDSDLYLWIIGSVPAPDAYRSPMLERLMRFHGSRP